MTGKRQQTPCPANTPPTVLLLWLLIFSLLWAFNRPVLAATTPTDLESVRQAATSGNADAQNRLGTIYLSGHGVTPDPNLAASWFQSAANQGHPEAQLNLGTMHFGGMGLSQDLTQAAQWFKKAASRNNLNAQLLLGHMYQNGSGVPKDPRQALKWYDMAAAQGHPEAVRQRQQLVASLTPPPTTPNHAERSTPVASKKTPPVPTVKRHTILASYQPVATERSRPPAPPKPANTKPITHAKPSKVTPQAAKPAKTQHMAKLATSDTPPTGRRSATLAKAEPAPEPAAAHEKPKGQNASQAWAQSQADPKANATKPAPVTTLLPVPSPAPAPTNNPQAAKEAEAGKQSLKENQLPEAILHYTKAHELDPGNLDWLHNAATLSLQANEQTPALEYFRRATALAVAANKKEDVLLYTGEISKILNQMPPWVDEALAKAGAIPDNKAGTAAMWSKSRESAMQAAENGQLDQAIRLGKQTVDLARENLGANHAATFMSERELGTFYTLNRQATEAEPILRQAVTHAASALGTDHPESLAASKALAELLEAQSQQPAAIKIYQESQTGYNARLGNKHPLALDNERALARALQNQGQFNQADPLLRASCQTIAKLFGYYHPETARCLTQFAALQLARGEIPAAQAEYEQALAIQQATLPPDDPGLPATQLGLADTNRRLGHYHKAHERLKPILATEKPGAKPSDPVITEAKTILTHLHLDQGDFTAAETLAKQLLAQLTAELGPEHPATLGMRTDLAGIHEKQGLLAEAEAEIKQTLESYRKTYGDMHPASITTMNNLGQLLEAAGLYDEAEPLLRQALNLAEKNIGSDQPLTLTTMNNLALLHESQGNFDKAEPLYQNAINAYRKRLGDRHPDTVAVVNNLAYLHLLRQDDKKAAPLFKQVLSVWSETLGENHQRTLKAMNNLARATHHLGQHKEAEKLFLTALEKRRKALGEHHMDVLRSMHDLALLYRDMGRLQESEELLRKTRSEDEKLLGPLHPYTFEILNALASVLEKTNPPEALTLRKEIFSRRSDFLDRMLWSTGDNAREGYIRLYTPELDDYLAQLAKADRTLAGQALLEVGLRRKGLLLKVASEIRQIVRLGDDPNIKATSEQLTATRKQLAALTLSGPTQESADQHLATIHKLEQTVDELQQKLGQTSKRFQRTSATIPMEALIKHLPDKAALVEFLIYKEGEHARLVATILHKEQNQPVFDTALYPDMDAIQKAVINYRTLIQDEEAEEDEIKQMGQSVYQLIWAPIKKVIGNRETVYLVPDGILNILPFPALVDPDEIYLTRSTDLHILSSSRDLIPSELPRAKGQYLIMAGPDYDSNLVSQAQTESLKEAQGRRSSEIKQGLRAFSSGMRGLHFSPLPGAEKEGKLISGQATDKKKLNTILLKNDAQENALLSLAAPPEILHIATHGFFLKPDDNLKKRLLKLARSAELTLPPPGDNPLLRAGLAFAGINANAQYLGELDTNNDGVLTALEVLGLDLTGTQLTVLSACETGLGEIHEGEGVYGLRRAFQEAGAQSVISSLWEVSDAGTQALMTNLYARLGDGMSAHQALRESQLDLLESSSWNLPYIWSAFMMVGQ